MKAFGHDRATTLDEADALIAFDAPEPAARATDLVVAVKAVSVNPVDWKVRRTLPPAEGAGPRILGWDAAGVVLEAGPGAEGFAPGDRVWYAGAIDRPGSNAERQAVDHRITARMPASLGFAEAAALPLTAITAWEALFDRLGIPEGGAAGQAILIVGAGGGVGSIAVQIARALTGLRVIATAGRAGTRDWLAALGAHHVIDHCEPLGPQVAALVPGGVDHVIAANGTDQHLAGIVESLRPQGRLCLIDDPERFDIGLLKRKSLSLHWEFMFTRPLFGTPDIARQGRLLARVAALVDEGRVRTTLADHLGRLSVATLRTAHERLEAGTARGKIVLET